ncbi:MAG: hypothetical protein OER86_05540 [Phycisphaerae bacterium]|nr:hypothetical protein [Phycisphaerae bacterium]
MATNDTCCTLNPYFTAHPGMIGALKAMCDQFVQRTSTEDQCLYYGFSFDGETMFCREGYTGAEGVLAHLQNVGPLLEEALKIADLTRLEVHGPEAELAKLRKPLKDLNPQFFVLEYGFRK